ncbi:MAG: trypsin-like peptidase domain-containing protein [Actinomycetales bacterium]|nr:trypsin-like peptidase domain-containing protein [Actinomycetales bacterium]
MLLFVALPILAFILISEVVNVVQRSLNSDSLERKMATEAAKQGLQNLPQLGADAEEAAGAAESARASASPPADLPRLIAMVLPSTVLLECQESAETVSQGSGFALDPSALGSSAGTVIVTNWHVVKDCPMAAPVFVTTSDRESHEGSVVGMDEDADLAIISAPTAPLTPLSPQTRKQQGDWVMAAGNPQGITGTTTTGTIANLPPGTGEILSDVLIAPGSSGGPLVNGAGAVIGVTSAVLSDSDGFSMSRDITLLCQTLLICSES